jgi:hypothetical protein
MPKPDTADSTPIFEAAAEKKPPSRTATGIALFVLNFVLHNDVFRNHFLSQVPGAVERRTPTFFGEVVTGVLLVLGYAIWAHLKKG